MSQVVTAEAQLRCSAGSAPARLMVTSQSVCMLGGKLVATIEDASPAENFVPAASACFGPLCSQAKTPPPASTPLPCTPQIAGSSWSLGSSVELIAGKMVLLEGATLTCLFPTTAPMPGGPGTIEISALAPADTMMQAPA